MKCQNHCKYCGNLFTSYPSEHRIFCSNECRFSWFRLHPLMYWLGKKRPEVTNFFTMKGKHHSDETKLKMSLAGKGKIISQEQRTRISNTLLGHLPNKGSGIGKSGLREFGVYCRSRWEANIIRTFLSEGIGFLYEPFKIRLSTSTYTPDFFIPQYDWFIECKGFMNQKSADKLQEFKTWCQERGFIFTLIQKNEYSLLENQYKESIPFWEKEA